MGKVTIEINLREDSALELASRLQQIAKSLRDGYTSGIGWVVQDEVRK